MNELTGAVIGAAIEVPLWFVKKSWTQNQQILLTPLYLYYLCSIFD